MRQHPAMEADLDIVGAGAGGRFDDALGNLGRRA